MLFLEISEIKTIAKLLREEIVRSKCFPSSLSGACNASSILLKIALDSKGIQTQIISNSKHSFLLYDDTVIDITATQISKEHFAEITILPLNQIQAVSNSFLRGKGFYRIGAENGLCCNSIDEYLQPRTGMAGDIEAIFRLLTLSSKIMQNPSLLPEKELFSSATHEQKEGLIKNSIQKIKREVSEWLEEKLDHSKTIATFNKLNSLKLEKKLN